MKFKEGNVKFGTWGGILPCNRTGWGLTGWKQACREEAEGLMDKLNRNQQCFLTANKVKHIVVCISRSIGRTSSKVILHFAEYYENTSEALCLFWAEKEMNKPESSEEGQWTGAYDII